MNFTSLGLQDNLVKAIHELGFTEPTAIQEQSIPVLLAGNRDYIGLAQTGTGKTAAFGLPMIQRIDPKIYATQALIICPTRELCIQITAEISKYAIYTQGITAVPVYGGVAIDNQIRALKKAQIVVGTPGRLLDHLSRGTLSLNQVRIVVLDEADEMFNMGFQEDIHSILGQVPHGKNIWLFSATMPDPVERIAQKYMTDPHKVTIGVRNSGAKNLEHQYCIVKPRDNYLALRRFIDIYPDMFGILFCRTRRDAKDLTEKLVKDGYGADALHGDLSQSQRDFVMKKFRNGSGKMQLLIATDVAARGLDVTDVTHVIHYNIPEDLESYTHRSGRTARAGKSGISIAILSPRDVRRVSAIERQIGQKMNLVRVPTGADICAKQIEQFAKKFDQTVSMNPEHKQYVQLLAGKLERLTKEELLARYVTLELTNYFASYQHAPDLNSDASASSYGSNSGSGSDFGDDKTRLFINVGTIDGLEKGSFIEFISKETNVQESDIMSVALKSNFTFFSAKTPAITQQIIQGLKTKSLNGRKLRVESTGSERRGNGGGGSSNNNQGFARRRTQGRPMTAARAPRRKSNSW